MSFRPAGASVSVERAGELRLPPDATRFAVRWAVGDEPGASFGDQILAGLAAEPSFLLLDEVRSPDEPGSHRAAAEHRAAAPDLGGAGSAPS
ncbi:MAG: hypothetical protein U0521_09870 [Anaerolineae bacterium]